jgi:hypothetical protein
MKFTVTKQLASAALLLCLGTGAANAALITYSDRTAFDSANPSLSFEGFENVTSIDQVLNGTNIADGVRFALTSGSDAYLAPTGQSSNTSQAVGVNTPASAGWEISFSTAVNAVGFDVFQNFGGGDQSGRTIIADVNVYGASGLLGSFTTSIPSGAAGFAGVFSNSDLITSITVNNVDSYDVIDNVEFGLQQQAAEVPEPGLLGLFGIGIAGLLASRKRKS